MRPLIPLLAIALPIALMLTACAALTGSAPASTSSASPAAYCSDNPSCLTTPDCTMDPSRACLSCRCSAPMGPNPGLINSESVPPMR